MTPLLISLSFEQLQILCLYFKIVSLFIYLGAIDLPLFWNVWVATRLYLCFWNSKSNSCLFTAFYTTCQKGLQTGVLCHNKCKCNRRVNRDR